MFRSPAPHRHSRGNIGSRRVFWVPNNKYATPHQGSREIERRRTRSNVLLFERVLRFVEDACITSDLVRHLERHAP